MQFDPRSEQIKYNLGLALLELKNMEEALRIFKTIIQTNQKHADAANAIGFIYQVITHSYSSIIIY